MSNKDEALRAKDLAEEWMRKSDFTTARRVALKAQKMDETLENIAHMIMVCDVHCATLEKFEDEMDWYKILQVDKNADEIIIKKQYRKLALLLHPDKNTLPGAESAFKTIGEALRVLSDKDRRRVHDMRRKPSRGHAPTVPSYQPQQAPNTEFCTQPVFLRKVNVTTNDFTAGWRAENLQQPQVQSTGFSGVPSFCTLCAYCCMKHVYSMDCINKLMNCSRCGKQYVAFHPIHDKIPTHEAGKAQLRQLVNSSSIPSQKVGSNAKNPGTSAEKSNGKGKRKKIVDSSDSSSDESSCEWEEVAASVQHSRRSARRKHQVSYKENMSDDDMKEKDSESDEETHLKNQPHVVAEYLRRVKERQAGSSRDSGARNAAKDSRSGSASDVEMFVYADLDFTNFNKLREEKCFKAGQIWAMYDDIGRMPRYYAMIRKVRRKPSFLLKITWLEAKPDDEKAKQWLHKKLPLSVSKFELGGDKNTNEISLFSHPIHCSVRSMKDIVSVYPRIGETWALFKKWDINWSSVPRRNEYEFVEILSEYDEGTAIEAVLLHKVKGFVSVFGQLASSGTFQIPPHELLRFSHNIPSIKLTGKERNGVPGGSYELDTAALPPRKIKEEEASVFVSLKPEPAKSNQVHRPHSSKRDCVIIHDYQFHDFNTERLQGKFSIGQIWSLKTKEDSLPKSYAKIEKIVWKPAFKLHINLLELESLPETVTPWHDKKMPVSCGNFTVKENQIKTLNNSTTFSHQIKAQHSLRKNEYTILPKTGEIWAIYKNWSEKIKVESLKKCEYEVVEVIDDNESHIEVMMLERVDGYISVFKEKVEGGMNVKKKIPRCELLRFSHYVPAFRLTGNIDEDLRGSVELDSAALSRNLLRS